MTKTTNIQWTDFTVNFWEGCQKVGPGCDHCYAEARDVRFTAGKHWGPGAPRRWVKGGIAKLRTINRNAEAFKTENGHWPRVFCSSLSDVFDNAVAQGWREEAWHSIDAAPDARIQLLTKRVGNVEKLMPARWRYGWPSHVGLMITVVNQAEADRDIPKLLDLKERLGIPWVGLSIEPMLGAITLDSLTFDGDSGMDALNVRTWEQEVEDWRDTEMDWAASFDDWYGHMPDEKSGQMHQTLDWVICGGESGPNSRPMHPDWARALRDQCVAAGVPFFFKQWGRWGPDDFGDKPLPCLWMSPDGTTVDGSIVDVNRSDCQKPMSLIVNYGRSGTDRFLDGREWDQMPEAQE